MKRVVGERAKHLASLVLLAALLASLWAPAAAAGVRHAAPVHGESARTEAVDRAIAWLRTQQQADGSFTGGFGSAAGATADVVTAAAAVGLNALTWQAALKQPTVYDYMISQAGAYAEENAGAAGKLVVALAAGNADPRDLAGVDLVARLLRYDGGSGVFDAAGINQAWAILGLLAAHEPLPTGALMALAAMQQPDGGWDSGYGTDAGTTALALEALAAGSYQDEGTQVLADGLAYLRAHQSATGGFFSTDAYGSTAADADSTAICAQALVALGENPLAANWLMTGASALDDLLTMQTPSGAFEWQAGAGASLLSTVAAIPALVGRSLPIAGAGVALWDALRYLASVQQSDGGFEGNLSNSSYALLALAAAGESPRDWKSAGGASVLDYLETAADQITDAGLAGRLLAALAMANENPRKVGKQDIVAILRTYYDETSGSYDRDGNVWNQALAIWGLQAVGEPAPALALDWLRAAQNADGGWGWAAGGDSDTNSTALAMQALLATGTAPGDARIVAALSYLEAQQTDGAGFAWDKASPWYTGPDANSTAMVIEILLNTDAAAFDGWRWARSLTETDETMLTVFKPMDSLLAFQLPGGAFEWQPGESGGPNYLATVQAVPALAQRVFPRPVGHLAASEDALASWRWVIWLGAGLLVTGALVAWVVLRRRGRQAQSGAR